MIKYQGISTLEVLVEAKNYNTWISNEIRPHITAPALEIGAGTGNLTAQNLKIKPLYVTDKDHGLIQVLKKRFTKEKKIFVKQLDITKKTKKEFISFFSTLYAINVFEHIKNDELAFEHTYEMLKNNGKLVILVPAKQFAYTKLDRELGHFRRYEKKELIQKLENAGYHVESIKFFNIIGLISWYIRDKVKKKNIDLKPYHIMIFDSIVPLLRFIESIIKVPVGISLIAVARKKNRRK